MKDFDQIRILWIDDREEMDGYPEAQLPQGLDEWFQIVHHSASKEAMSYREANEFASVLQRFWFGNNRDILPAEIIATDYNLSKRGGLVILDQTDKEVDRDLLEDNEQGSAEYTTMVTGSMRSVNFEGLLISLFYSTLTYNHPSAIVPMTRYLGDMPSEVQTLHTLVEPFMGVDFQRVGLEDRKWSSIVYEGVKHLRRRIENLYESGDIVISTDDLMSLAESPDHQTLTIQSPFAKRRWPVQGLFIDVPESKRYAQVQEWARKLVQLKVNFEVFKQARELSKLVWTAYESRGDMDLVKERAKLSLFARKKGNKGGQGKPIRVFGSFKIQGDAEVEPFVDIRVGGYSKDVRRWAALLIIIELISRFIVMKKRLEEYAGKSIEGPVLNVEDIYLALFPLPKNPVILPWDMERTDKNWKNRFNAWEQYLGRLQLSIRDVMRGKDLSEGSSKGLRPSEREILQGFLVGYKDLVKDCKLEESPYAQWGPARRILWGEEPEVS